ncbi:MAG: thioesterase family protein [Sciscionella sp.]
MTERAAERTPGTHTEELSARPDGTEAFYTPLGEGRFRSERHTSGPWDPQAQHFGPPSALLMRSLQQLAPPQQGTLARITVEILGPVGLGELAISAQVLRPGRSVRLLRAELRSSDRLCATANAWQIANTDTAAIAAGQAEPPPGPAGLAEWTGDSNWGGGYLNAIQWRSAHGGFGLPGPAVVWARPRLPLVAGEVSSPLQRLMLVADSGNGLSAELNPREWYFINSELTVHLHRVPQGEWIALDAAMLTGSHGVGTARTVLHDRTGQVGSGAQALLLRRR